MRYRVKWDFQKAAPLVWAGDKRKRFGDQNEGFTIDAEGLDAARAALREAPHRLNPFYLTVELEP